MGDIADMMLDGILDEQTGEFLGDGVGYPRTNQSGYYNSTKKRKPKRNIKHAMKGNSIGGLHLVGKKVTTEKHGNGTISEYINKNGRKGYVITDDNDITHKVKFTELNFI